MIKEENLRSPECDPQNLVQDKTCLTKQEENSPSLDTAKSEPAPQQKLEIPPCTDCKVKKSPEKQLTSFEGRATREEKIL
nr:PREDICTED: leucine zipper protein 2 [Equus przewalskii]